MYKYCTIFSVVDFVTLLNLIKGTQRSTENTLPHLKIKIKNGGGGVMS